jgi:carboxymethylenebutenolidase
MGNTIHITAADGHRLGAWRAGPSDATRGLVVVQEIFGVNAHMRRVCAAFAEQGYAVIAPALFDRVEHDVQLGYGPDDMARGRALRAKLPEAGVLADIEEAARALGNLPTGIVGYCWGGTVAWWGATRSSRFRAAVGWYGAGIAATRSASPHCPVQLHFGEKDASIPLSDIEQIRAAQPDAEIFVYPGAQHGFGCEERPSYSAPDADLAQKRTLAFFDRTLRA